MPSVEVIGVYALPFSQALAKEQLKVLYARGMSEAERAEALSSIERQLRSTVLVEVLIENAGPKFDIGSFCKPERELPRSHWQSPWAERFLSSDGSKPISDQFPDAVPQTNAFRVAFYIHFWHPGAYLLGPTGALACPEVTAMPERLKELVPYVLLD
jgi:hypothetical protein